MVIVEGADDAKLIAPGGFAGGYVLAEDGLPHFANH
jgi:hypothetical protein